MRESMRLVIAGAAVVWLIGDPVAWAGSISSVSVNNLSTDGSDSHGAPSCAQTRTNVGVLTQNSTSFSTRFQQGIAADSRLTTAISISQNASYIVNFSATCPAGPYELHVSTSLNGAFTVVDDASGCGAAGSASADVSGVNGSFTGGSLSGSLSLLDPGGENNAGARDVAFNRIATGTITNTSAGAPIAHSLSFSWSGSAASNADAFTCGLEGALRLGLQETFSPCQGLSSTTEMTADDYPGVNNRTAANDGHFVTVTLECLCGNGVIGAGEECDAGALNGLNGSCCSSTCTILPEFATCRVAASSCDIPELCGGITGDCPPDVLQMAGSSCASDSSECTEDVCNGSGGCTHPAEAMGVSCNSGAGSCDGSGNCGPLLTPTRTASPTPTATPPVLCGATPLSGCRQPAAEKASLSVQYRAGNDRLKWKWARGASTAKQDFGDPLTTTNYTLCVYQSTAGVLSLATSLRVPAGGFCGTKPCWKDTPKGFKYSDSLSSPDGMSKLVLKAGVLGKASITAQGRDPNLTLPLPVGGSVLKQDTEVVVQLVNDLAIPVCWEAHYPMPAQVNNFEKFKDRSQ